MHKPEQKPETVTWCVSRRTATLQTYDDLIDYDALLVITTQQYIKQLKSAQPEATTPCNRDNMHANAVHVFILSFFQVIMNII